MYFTHLFDFSSEPSPSQCKIVPVVRGAKFGTFYIVIRKLEFSISGILDCINKTGFRDSARNNISSPGTENTQNSQP